MPATLAIRDESTGGDTLHERTLEFLTERITVRELIRERVYQEVMDYNTRQPEAFNGLVQPKDAERTLDGFRLRQPRRINWEAQLAQALEAFAGNGMIILVNDRQAESLEEEFVVGPETDVVFLRLVPLVGG